MANSKIYLDHNASSPLLPEASAAMTEIGQVAFANPSSPHWAGREARILLEESREKLAQALGTKPQEIFFTSG
ncbi:MAG: aminotransferase class V-fold PLP-dependent enzyme, partial [SAR324 cluster bacterium]|nr:aminotransferase class V-fold PLP-dependent enzyme [SAR324 cluster bacterium]